MGTFLIERISASNQECPRFARLTEPRKAVVGKKNVMQITYSHLDPRFYQELERTPLKGLAVNELIGAAALAVAKTAE